MATSKQGNNIKTKQKDVSVLTTNEAKGKKVINPSPLLKLTRNIIIAHYALLLKQVHNKIM